MEERPLHILEAGLVNTTRVQPNITSTMRSSADYLFNSHDLYRHIVQRQEELQPGLKLEDEEETVYSCISGYELKTL